ncbi:MAG: alpha/beta hydrolase, partial [Tepidisphaeraceae bacterium]
MSWPRSNRSPARWLVVLLFVGLATAGGCGGKPQLMATPNLYTHPELKPYADVPPALQHNRVEVLYVTDRLLEKDATPQAPVYGSKRSRSVAFGISEVQFGTDVTWDQLVEASTSSKRSVKLEMNVIKTTELRRFPPTPKVLFQLPNPLTAGTKPATAPSTLRTEVDEDIAAFQRELSARLAKTPVKEVYIYVHGVSTSFDSSILTIAEIWHFLGRQGVPITYSWPSGGGGGPLRGYMYDYNSSEFT